MFKLVEYAINVNAMFPDEPADVLVIEVSLKTSIAILVPSFWA